MSMLPVPKNYYQVLQVDPSAEPEVIKAAYRRLADKYHPDRNKGADASARMLEINEAYNVLGDDARRAAYDATFRGTALPPPQGYQAGGGQPGAESHQQAYQQAYQQTYQPPPPQPEKKGPYSAEISRTNPTLFVFLLDQSGSMKDQFGGKHTGVSKAAGVADAVNRMLSNLVIRCSQGDTTRNYFDAAVIGYGAQKGLVAPALGGALAGRDVVSIAEIGSRPARIEDRVIKQPDGAGGIIDVPVKFPIWFEPVAYGDTPMCRVLDRAREVVERWIAQHRSAFPPIVINLTDGESTDGDPMPHARKLVSLRTEDGNVLLFNCHISSVASAPILFPDRDNTIPDPYGKAMFAMSSTLTPTMRDYAGKQGFPVSDRSRGFVFQADLVDVIRFLDIGTRPADLR